MAKFQEHDRQDDPVGATLDLDGKVGKWVTDPSGAYRYYVPEKDTELPRLNADYGIFVQNGMLGMAPQFERLGKNERAYAGLSGAGEPKLVIPIVRRDCNQLISSAINTCLSPNPITSFDPYTNAEYQIPTEHPMLGTGIVPVDAEKIAATLEAGFEFKCRERLKIQELFNTLWTEMITGMTPTYLKVIHSREARKMRLPAYKKAAAGNPWNVEIDGTREVEIPGSEATRFVPVSAWNIIVPYGFPLDEDLQTADWIAENTPWSTTRLRTKLQEYKSGGYCLIPPEKWEELLQHTTIHTQDLQRQRKEAVDRVTPTIPKGFHDVKEIHFRLAVNEKELDPLTGKEKTYIRLAEMVGCYHFGYRSFIAMWELPYEHQMRPYVPFFQRKRPRELSGTSTCEDLTPFQIYISEILHMNLKNAAIANSTPVVADPDTDAFEWVSENPLDSASVIPGKKDDIVALNFGREYRSMMPEINWLDAQGSRTSNVSIYEQGAQIPGRTSPNTTSQILQAGAQQPLHTLRDFSASWAEAVKMWLRTYRQFEPYGELLSVRNPESQQIVQIAFQLPTEECLDNFRITLTAADEAIARENEFEQLAMLANMLDADAEAMAKVLGPFASTGIPPEIAAAFRVLIERKQKIVESMIERSRKDARKFVLSSEILDAIDQGRTAALLQQQAAAAAQGGMNGQLRPGAPPPEGAPPGGPPPGMGAEGPGGPPGEPPLPEMGPGNPEQGMAPPIG